MARSSYDDNAMRYVLPVFWMTSWLSSHKGTYGGLAELAIDERPVTPCLSAMD